MTSRVPVGGYAAETDTEATARPGGLSLGQWLNARADQAGLAAGGFRPPSLAGSSQDISEIHRRLDSITQQINQISQSRPAAARPAMGGNMTGTTAASASGLASQLNDAISRLDSRLARLSQDAGQYRPAAGSFVDPSRPETPPAPAYAPPAPPAASPRPAALDLNSAIAEINARRGELDRGQAFAAPRQPSPPLVPSASPGPNFTSLERQLHLITSQMETLRRPDTVDRSIAAFRDELAEIRHSLTEALPRQAIESLEAEIRSLAQRIDRSRDDGVDRETLGNIERALNDIYGVVRTLTPAEQLHGYDAAIAKLSEKIDLIVRASPDSGGVQQLQDAITALRGIAANIASNEALGRLGDHIQALSEKVDHLAASSGSDMLSALEQRIALLTSAMERRPEGGPADAGSLEAAVRALTDRMDNLGHADGVASMAQIEQRVSHLLQRLETVEPRFNNTARVEESLGEILRHLEYQRQAIAGLGDLTPHQPTDVMGRGIVDSIKRELSDVRDSQAENDRRTQDTLEAVHSTLSHVVDRLAMIEGDLKRTQSGSLQADIATSRPSPPLAPNPPPVPPPAVHVRPELPNPVVTRTSPADVTLSSSAFDTAGLRPAAAQGATELLGSRTPPRRPIDSTLPPDFPLEPGLRKPDAATTARGSIAPSDADASREGSSKSNFIAAARRAAQAASAATVTPPKPSRVTMAADAARSVAKKARFSLRPARQANAKPATKPAKPAAPATALPSAGTEAKPSKVKAVVVGLCVAIILFGGFKMAMNFLAGYDNPPAETAVPEPQAAEKQKQDAPPSAPLAPPLAERQSMMSPVPLTPPPASEAMPPVKSAEPPAPLAPVSAAGADVTGSTTQSAKTAALGLPDSAAAAAVDPLPEALAGPALRAAALRGDPTAAFEVAMRYAEGRGVAANYVEAAKWYERAAQKGLVPAMFRLGTILEKGSNGNKDIDAARRYYVLAAERGNAKAMHNLAVLDADGGGKGPNYKSASVWFRKAADHGIADSQYNLGILYARGIGVEQNLAESFKWFSLAAAQGDADAARKRDDVAKRLDQQSLAAAKLAIQTFTPEQQPNEAINVAAPAGGWDNAAPASKQAGKPAAKLVRQRDAAR